MQVVLEEGLDISSLPETLKEDFYQLDRLEGQYRVTGMLAEDLEDLSAGKVPSCGFCNTNNLANYLTELMEDYKPMITLSKVILRNLFSIYEIKKR